MDWFKYTLQHEFETNADYHLSEDSCRIEPNLLYRNLNAYLQARQNLNVLHVSNGFFVPDGAKVISPNFVDPSSKAELITVKRYPCPNTGLNGFCTYWTTPDLKKSAKNTLRHWTQEKVRT